MNRVVRRCFLLGDDSVTGKNYDHRKVWIEDQLRRLASHFGIDLLGFAILSKHFHLMLRSRPDCVETLNPIRAAMAETLESSDFTSVQRRIQAAEQAAAAGGTVDRTDVDSTPATAGLDTCKTSRQSD